MPACGRKQSELAAAQQSVDLIPHTGWWGEADGSTQALGF